MRSAGRTTLGAAALVGALGLGCARAAAGPSCPDARTDWQVDQGTLAPGPACGELFATTNAGDAQFSYGSFQFRRSATLPYRMEVTWRRLGSDLGWSMDLHLVGAIMLFKPGAVALFVDNITFDADGWHPLPGFRPELSHRIEATQTGDGISVRVDGRPAGRWRVTPTARAGQVGLGFKGAPGYRSRVLISGFRIEPAVGGR